MVDGWVPANELERRLLDAMHRSDQDAYFAELTRAELLLPVPVDAAGRPVDGWATWAHEGRTYLLAFTSPESLRQILGEYAGESVPATLGDIASRWPDPAWWLAVDFGLPIAGYLPETFVTQLVTAPPAAPAGPGDSWQPDATREPATETWQPGAATGAEAWQSGNGDAGGTGRSDDATQAWQPPAATAEPVATPPPAPTPAQPPAQPLPPDRPAGGDWPDSSWESGDGSPWSPSVPGAEPTAAWRPVPTRLAGSVSAEEPDAADVLPDAGPDTTDVVPDLADLPAEPGTATDDDFQPANDAEEALLAAARAGDNGGFLDALLTCRALLPVPVDAATDWPVTDPAFPWPAIQRGGGVQVPVFTSAERMRERVGESRFVVAPFILIVEHWPNHDWALALNPDTAIGATLSGDRIRELADWSQDQHLAERLGIHPAPAPHHPPTPYPPEPLTPHSPTPHPPTLHAVEPPEPLEPTNLAEEQPPRTDPTAEPPTLDEAEQPIPLDQFEEPPTDEEPPTAEEDEEPATDEVPDTGEDEVPDTGEVEEPATSDETGPSDHAEPPPEGPEPEVAEEEVPPDVEADQDTRAAQDVPAAEAEAESESQPEAESEPDQQAEADEAQVGDEPRAEQADQVTPVDQVVPVPVDQGTPTEDVSEEASEETPEDIAHDEATPPEEAVPAEEAPSVEEAVPADDHGGSGDAGDGGEGAVAAQEVTGPGGGLEWPPVRGTGQGDGDVAERTPEPAKLTYPVVLQKVLPPGHENFYLERHFDQVGGYLHRVEDTARYAGPGTLRAALGETGGPTGSTGPCHVLRWTVERPGLLPVLAASYAAGDPALTEYRVATMHLPHGTELYRIGEDGGLTVLAVYDADHHRWHRLA